MLSEFRRSFDLIYIDGSDQILRLWDIETMEINGRRSPMQRAQIMKEFREMETSAVLIVSSVATAGLNLDCANILIIVVRSSLILSHYHGEADNRTRIFCGLNRTSNN